MKHVIYPWEGISPELKEACLKVWFYWIRGGKLTDKHCYVLLEYFRERSRRRG